MRVGICSEFSVMISWCVISWPCTIAVLANLAEPRELCKSTHTTYTCSMLLPYSDEIITVPGKIPLNRNKISTNPSSINVKLSPMV